LVETHVHKASAYCKQGKKLFTFTIIDFDKSGHFNYWRQQDMGKDSCKNRLDSYKCSTYNLKRGSIKIKQNQNFKPAAKNNLT